MIDRGSQRLRRGDRLRERRDYQRVSRDGIRLNSQSFVLIVTPRRDADPGATRLGITASRRVGPAVVRSFVKRRIREWFRRHRGDLPVSKDIVVIARASAASAASAALSTELSAGAAKLSLLIERVTARG